MVNSFQFHGPSSTTAVSFDKLKKKVAAANTSTDFVSKNKDLSAVVSKKPAEEQSSPKKNKKYENVSPRYMTANTIAAEKTPDLQPKGKKEAQDPSKLKPPIKQEPPGETLKKTENKKSSKDLSRSNNHIFESQKSLAPLPPAPQQLQPKPGNQVTNERGKTPSESSILKPEKTIQNEQLRQKSSVSPNPTNKKHINAAATNEEQVVKNVSKILGQEPQAHKKTEPLTSYSQINAKAPVSKPELEKENRENQPPKTKDILDPKPQRSVSPSATATQKKDSKKEPLKYKPETIDLCMKLDEYTKFKENFNIMNDPNPPLQQMQNPPVFVQHKPNGRQMQQNHHQQQLQTKERVFAQPEQNPEEFLKGKIHTFKDNSSKKRKPSTSIDLQRAAQPKYKKKAVDLVDNYSFQPMLSKKSLQIAEKRVSSSDPGILERPAVQIEDSYERTGRRQLQERSLPSEALRKVQTHRPGQASSRRASLRDAQSDCSLFREQGQEYSNRKKRIMKEKQREEEDELRALSFQPSCKKLPKDPHLKNAWDVDVADRNEKWIQRRDEKLSKLKTDFEKNQEDQCSFKPKIVVASDQTKYEKEDKMNDSQYYSSVFVKDGIKNYFTRLEQARRLKKEAQERLGSPRINR